MTTAEDIRCKKDFKTAVSLVQNNKAQRSATLVLGMHEE